MVSLITRHDEIDRLARLERGEHAAGNMTRVPIPAHWQNNRLGDFELTFDAWNRLVAVDDGSEVVDVIEKRPQARFVLQAMCTDTIRRCSCNHLNRM